MPDAQFIETHDLLSIIPGSIGLGIAALVALLILHDLRGPYRSQQMSYNVWLLVFIGALALQSLVDVLQGIDFFYRHVQFLGIEYAHWLLLPVALGEYIRALTVASAGQGKMRPLLRRYWSVAIAWVGLAIFVAQPSQIKLIFSDEENFDQMEAAILQMTPQEQLAAQIGALGFGVFWAIWMVLLIWAGWSIQRMLHRHDRWLKTNYSNIDDIDLSWIKQMLLICLVAIGVVVVDQIFTLGGAPNLSEWKLSIFVMGVVLGFGFLGIAKSEEILRTVTLTAPPALESEPAPQMSEVTAPKPYARSSMLEDDGHRIADKLDHLMRSDQLWKNSSLSLRRLSDVSGVTPHRISQALNICRGCNFYDYVNGFRVDDACKLLTSTDANVLSISEDVGFNSKSTFNAAFKKHTQQTPTQYRKLGVSQAVNSRKADKKRTI